MSQARGPRHLTCFDPLLSGADSDLLYVLHMNVESLSFLQPVTSTHECPSTTRMDQGTGPPSHRLLAARSPTSDVSACRRDPGLLVAGRQLLEAVRIGSQQLQPSWHHRARKTGRRPPRKSARARTLTNAPSARCIQHPLSQQSHGSQGADLRVAIRQCCSTQRRTYR